MPELIYVNGLKKMKICFLVNQLFSSDGWSSYSTGLIRSIQNKGVDCFVLSSVGGRKDDSLQIKNYRILPPLFTGRITKIYFFIKNFFQIRRLIKQADLVHVTVEPYVPFVRLVKGKKPLIITFHGSHSLSHLRNRYLRRFYNSIYRRSAKLICVSHFTEDRVLEKMPFLKNTSVINNGVDYDKYQIGDFSEKRLAGPIIISVGALMPRKGYHVSIRAVARIKEKYPDLKYYILGNQKNADYFGQLKKIAAEEKLTDSIVFLEGLSDDEKIRLYRQSDLFLLTPVYNDGSPPASPSLGGRGEAGDKFEGFGLVYLEANACGKPVVGTYGCGAEDAIKDGYSGFLVPQNNPEETAKAILKILDQPSLAQSLGVNGRQWAKDHDWSQVALKYTEIYQQFLKQE